ncbi:MAG: thioredoxin [Bacteroidetes bacterium]|nr:thioredoxin [Bacteroidota bacterium]
MSTEFTDTNFDEKVLQEEKPVVVDFWAEWCGPCRVVGPIIDELGDDYDGKIVIGKLDVDHNPEISMKYGIRSIPTVLFFKGGEIVDRHVGSAPKALYQQKLESLLDN